MRRTIGKLATTTNTNCTKQNLISSSSNFSTFSGGSGRGRGRGGAGTSGPSFAGKPIGKPQAVEDANADSEDPFLTTNFGVGRGRGKPISSSPLNSNDSSPSFTPWIPGINPSRIPQESQNVVVNPKRPIFFRRGDSPESAPKSECPESDRSSEDSRLPSSLLSGLPGSGRGKPVKLPGPKERPGVEENRHIRRRPDGPRKGPGGPIQQVESDSPSSSKLSREEAVKKAIGILSRGRGGGRDVMEDGGGGRGGGRLRGRGGRGRGRGGRGAEGWQQRGGRGRGRFQAAEDDFATGLYLGDNADGEKLAKRVGVENMDKLVEAFEEMSGRVLPSPMDDAYLDALHTNNLIEYEPEYLMGEFGTNPDIDEKPPIPLRDAFEKMKPFLMAYEGIQSQDEWEEIMKEVMEKLPYMKELIDIYSGPDRVTAKQQEEELERVANTLPDNVPSSVRRFTDRAVLSLKSNPGWGFDKKCQFMDKLVWEVSQHYK